MKEIIIFTDGACSQNPGPGGWGAVLTFGNIRKELSGFSPHTTNNKMELQGAIEALNSLKEPCDVKLHTDSAYLCNAFLKNWLAGWQRNGWQTSTKKPVENRDLWEQLLALNKIHTITFVKVLGHSDNVENNRCDTLAKQAIKDGLSKAH